MRVDLVKTVSSVLTMILLSLTLGTGVAIAGYSEDGGSAYLTQREDTPASYDHMYVARSQDRATASSGVARTANVVELDEPSAFGMALLGLALLGAGMVIRRRLARA